MRLKETQGSKYRTPLIFFIFIFVGTSINFFLRSSLEPVFDETVAIKYIENDVQKLAAKNPWDYYKKQWKNIWYEDSRKGVKPQRPLQHLYRPLVVISVSSKILLCHIFNNCPWVPVLINSLILSLAGGLNYLLGWQLTRDQFSSALATFFMMFSMPALTGTWVTLTGDHLSVSLLMSLAILSYLNFKRNHSKVWMIPIILIAFLGPLYKEFPSIALFIIFVTELSRHDRNWRFLLVLVPFLIHSLYPAFFINLIFFHHVVFSSFYAKMQVLPRMVLGVFHFHSINHLFFTLPPLLVFFGIGSLFFNLFSQRKYPSWVFGVVFLFFLGCYYSLFIPQIHFLQPVPRYLTLILAIAVSLSALMIHKILFLWSFFTWFPYLAVYFGEVHLTYALGPFFIILFWHVKRFFTQCLKFNGFNNYKIFLAGFTLILTMLDQGLNMVAVDRVFKETNQSARQMAHHLSLDAREGKPLILLSHTLLGHDVEYFLKKNENRSLKVSGFTFKDAVSWEESYSIDLKFLNLLKRERSIGQIYFLDIDAYPTLLSQFIQQFAIPLTKVYEYESSISYPYLDFLKFFIPFEYTSFPGSPDMIDHFSRDRGLFRRRVHVKYILYRLDQ